MKRVLFLILGIAGLGLTLIPSLLVFAGKLSLATHHQLMLAGLALWFVAAPNIIGKR